VQLLMTVFVYIAGDSLTTFVLTELELDTCKSNTDVTSLSKSSTYVNKYKNTHH
jgi:hypothetical protein